MQQGEQAKPMLWVWTDNDGQNCKDAANTENFSNYQRTVNDSHGGEQWK
jgi:hypothetical protein